MRDSVKLLVVTIAIILSITALVSTFDYSSNILYSAHNDISTGPGGANGVIFTGNGTGNAGNGQASTGGASGNAGSSTTGIAGSSGKDIDNSFLKLIAGVLIFIASKLSGLFPALASTISGFGSGLMPHEIPPIVSVPPVKPSTGALPSATAPAPTSITDNIANMALPMAVLLLVILAIGFVILKKYNIPLIKKQEASPIPGIDVRSVELPATFEGAYRLLFPGISEPFPLLWGIGEPVEIEIGNKDGISENVMIMIDAVPEGEIGLANGRGKATLKLEKGRHVVEIKPASIPGREASRAELRIVDYREEVVSLYNLLHGHFKAEVPGFRDDMTPREMEYLVGGSLPEGERLLLDNAVSVFEIANFSVHSIDRPEYEKMYLSRIGIV